MAYVTRKRNRTPGHPLGRGVAVPWEAATLAVTVVLGLGGLVFILMRMLWENQKEHARKLEDRLKSMEDDHVFLKPIANHLRKRMEQDAVRMAEEKGK